MNTSMSSVEFFGIFLAAVASIMSVLFMMVAYAAAKARHFRMMLRYLRLAGMLSISSWVAMVTVMLRCEKNCWVVRQQSVPASPVFHETQYSVITPGGANVKWRKENAGEWVSGFAGGSGRSSGRSGLVSGGSGLGATGI